MKKQKDNLSSNRVSGVCGVIEFVGVACVGILDRIILFYKYILKRGLLYNFLKSVIILSIFIFFQVNLFGWTSMYVTGDAAFNNWAQTEIMQKDDYNTAHQHWHYCFKPSATDSDFNFKFIGDGNFWTDDYGDDDTSNEPTGDSAEYQNGNDDGLEINLNDSVYAWMFSFDTDGGATDLRYEMTKIVNVALVGQGCNLSWTATDTKNSMTSRSTNRAVWHKTVYLTNSVQVQFLFLPNDSYNDPIGNSWKFANNAAGTGSSASSGTAYMRDGGNLSFTPSESGYYLFEFNLITGAYTITKNDDGFPNTGEEVAWYNFNSDVDDLSGNGNDGTLVNMDGSDYVIGRFARALDFNGTDERVTLPEDDGDFDLEDAMTLEAWIKPSTTAGSRMIIGKPNAYFFWISAGNLRFEIYDGAWQNCQYAYTDTTYWHHVAATYDGTVQRLYIDGVQVKTNAISSACAVNNNQVAIGDAIGWNRYFQGKIDEIRIYNKVIAPQPAKYYADIWDVRISEVGEDFNGIGNNDWIELFNPTYKDINLNGTSIQRDSNDLDAGASSQWNLGATDVISNYGYILWADDGADASVNRSGEALNVIADRLQNLVINDDDNLLFCEDQSAVASAADTNIIDMLGLGVNNAPETTGSADILPNRSLKRKSIASGNTWSQMYSGAMEYAGHYYDTDDNSADFLLGGVNSKGNPQGTGSTNEKVSLQISSPATVGVNQSFSITITIKDVKDNTLTSTPTIVYLYSDIGPVSPNSITLSSGTGTATISIGMAGTNKIYAYFRDIGYIWGSTNISVINETIAVDTNTASSTNLFRANPSSDKVAFIGFSVDSSANSTTKAVYLTNIGLQADSQLTNLGLYIDSGTIGYYDGTETIVKLMTNVSGRWVATNLSQSDNQNYIVAGRFKRSAVFGKTVKMVIPENGIRVSTDVYGPQDPLTNANNQTVATTEIIINEVRYDSFGADTADFIELRGPANASLYDIFVQHYDGGGAGVASGWPAAGQNLSSYNIPDDGGGVGYFLMGTNDTLSLDYDWGTEGLQNGPDAIVVFYSNVNFGNRKYLDTLQYEGSNSSYVFPRESPYEAGSSDSDDSISRIPDGTDTDDNDSDFMVVGATPGAENQGGFASFVFSPTNKTVGTSVTALTLTITPMGANSFTGFVITNNSRITYSSTKVSDVLTNGVSISGANYSESGLRLFMTNFSVDSSDNLKVVYNTLTPVSSGELEFSVWGAKGSGLEDIGNAAWRVGLNPGDITISEISWNNDAEYEWIELYNTTSYTLNLKDCFINDGGGGGFTFSGDNDLEPHWYYLLEAAEAATAIPSDEVYGISAVALNIGGDLLVLRDLRNITIETLNFESGWPAGADTGGDTDTDGTPNDGVSMERMNLITNASVSTNWKDGPGIGAASETNQGGYGEVGGTPKKPNLKTVDGIFYDWSGIASGTNTFTVSGGEWIWSDRTNDMRGDLTGTTNNLDIKEFRVAGDLHYIYFLVKMYVLESSNLPHFAITWDNDRNSSDSDYTWIGADSDTTLGNARQYGERIIDFHSVGDNYRIEMWAGGTWYAPPTTGYAVNINTQYNCIEARIRLADLDSFSYPGTIRISAGILKNTGNTNQNNNGTVDIGGSSDFIDVITPSFQNSWAGDLSDGDIDFWADIGFTTNGIVSNNVSSPVAPTLVYPPTDNYIMTNNYTNILLTWNSATDADGDSVFFYLVQVSTISNPATFLSGLLEDSLRSSDIGEATNYKMTTACTDGGDYYFRVRGYDNHGQAGTWSAIRHFYFPRARRIIDGDPSDWGDYNAGYYTNSSFVSLSNEWVWIDRIGDDRANIDGDGASDLKELRLIGDSRFLYILARYDGFADTQNPMFSIALDTDDNSSDTAENWIGDESGTSFYTNNQYAEHLIDIFINKVWYFNQGDANWSASSDPTNYAQFVSSDSNLIEARIPWKDLGINNTSVITMNISIAGFDHEDGVYDPSSGDTTHDYTTCDALDTFGFKFFQNSWNNSITNGKLKYYFSVSITNNGNFAFNTAPVRPAIIWPNGDNTESDPVIRWHPSTDADSDSIYNYHIQISTNNGVADFSDIIDDIETITKTTQYQVNSGYIIEGFTYYYRIRSYDEHGAASDWSTNYFVVGNDRIVVNGDSADWLGIPPVDVDSWVISSNEFIWKDDKGDNRRSLSTAGWEDDTDLIEFRIVGGTNNYPAGKNIFFMAKFADLDDSNNSRVNISIIIDTNVSLDSGDTWIGDDSLTTGSSVGIEGANAYADFNLNWCYDGNNDMYIYNNDWTDKWQKPASCKSFIGNATGKSNIFEGRLSLSSIGKSMSSEPVLRFMVSIAEFNSTGDPDSVDKTLDKSGASSDFMDTICPGQGDAGSDDIADDKQDYWFTIKFDTDGHVIAATAKGMNDENTLKTNYTRFVISRVAPTNQDRNNYIDISCIDDGNAGHGVKITNFGIYDSGNKIKNIDNVSVTNGQTIRLTLSSNGADETADSDHDNIINIYTLSNNLSGDDYVFLSIPYTNDSVTNIMDAVCWYSNTPNNALYNDITNAGEWATLGSANLVNYTNLLPYGDSCYFERITNSSVLVDTNLFSDWMIVTNGPNISILKTVTSITVVQPALNIPIPGATIIYQISCSNSGYGSGVTPIVYDMIPANTTFSSNFANPTGWTNQYSTVVDPDQSYGSSDYVYTQPPKTTIIWVRWIRKNAGDRLKEDESVLLKYSVTID